MADSLELTIQWLKTIRWSEVLHPLWLSLYVASIATIIATILGVLCAWGIVKSKWKIKEVFDTLFILPMVLPPTVMGYYLIVLLGRNSILGRWFEEVHHIRFMFTLKGAVIAAVIVAFPLIYKSARAAFEDIPPVYSEVAQNLGANPWFVFWLISLPLAIRGIVAGIMLAFARSLGEFGATLMIAGNLPGKTQTLSIAIYQAVQDGRDGYALFLTGIICVLCVSVLLGIGMIVRKKAVQFSI